MYTGIELFRLLLVVGCLIFVCFYLSSKVKSGLRGGVLKKGDYPGWALLFVSFVAVSFGWSMWYRLESGLE